MWVSEVSEQVFPAFIFNITEVMRIENYQPRQWAPKNSEWFQEILSILVFFFKAYQLCKNVLCNEF